MRKLVETISKNAREEIRVSLSEYQGHDLCDIRVYAESYAGDEWVATKKGISLSVKKLPGLIAALQRAEAEAKAAGLLKEPNEAPKDKPGQGDLAILAAG